MIEAVDKYIIEIQDVFKTGYVKIKGFKANGFYPITFIENLQEYSPETSYQCAYQVGKEDAEKENADYAKQKMKDAYKQGYESGLNDAWEAAIKLTTNKKDYPSVRELKKIFHK